ncbi:MAG: energy-coupling factor ABC transporter ATP-binding protein [Spirochaetes bacterium]|nr:energy-coupling factor ABC transporter ATP-binding protein [Spirochaetota bacterium]
MQEPLIKFNYIKIKYPGSNKIYTYNGKFELFSNDFVLFFGESGTGKSTIFKVLNFLIPEYEYAYLETDLEIKNIKIDFNNKNNEQNYNNINNVKKYYSPVYLFQNPYSQIVTPYVKNELVFPMENKNFDISIIKESFNNIAKEFNLFNYLDRKTYELSGGEIQKIQLASILATNPDIIFLDEPTSFLDIKYKNHIYKILKNLKNKKTIILIEHDFFNIIDHFNKFLILEKSSENKDEILFSLIQVENKNDFLNYLNNLKSRKIFFIEEISSRFKSVLNINNFLMSSKLEFEKKKLDSNIKIENLYFTYNRKKIKKYDLKNENFLLKNINLEIKKETIIILGNNGSGKTTLLKLITGILTPTYGKITKNNKSISIIFQNPETHFLFPHIKSEIESYINNINAFRKNIFNYFINNKKIKNLKELKNSILKEFTDIINFSNYLNKSPFELSEGEKRRFTLFLTTFNLINNCDLFLFDEPTFGQDIFSREIIINFIKFLKEFEKSIIIVTHDLPLAESIGDKIFCITEGTLVELKKDRINKAEELLLIEK